MTKKHVDYAGSAFPAATADTGSTAAAAIRPILNGDPATQATFQRPDENLRARTEIIRTELEGVKYLAQSDRAWVASLEPVATPGTILWNGVVANGGDGQFSITAGKRLTLRPFLAPRVSTPGRIVNRGVRFQTNLTVAGPINPPRAYGNANKYSIQFVNQVGGAVAVTYDPLLFRFTISTDTTPVTGRTKADVMNAFNAAATTAGQGITATLDSGLTGDIFAEGVTFVQGDPADYMVFSGAADAELHEIADTTFASFFADPSNALLENDVLAIWYDALIDLSFGGREQSIVDAPESPGISNIPVGSLFLARRFPERLHNAIPVATVVADQLLLLDGTLATKGLLTAVSGGAGELPLPLAAVPPRMLEMNPAGTPHSWGTLDDTKFVGGLQTVATIAARDAIPAAQRKEGMLVYSQDVDRHFVLEGGVTNGDWKEFGDDNRQVGGLQTVANTMARDAIPAAQRKEGMVVYSQADDRHFVLEGGLTNSDWRELGSDSRFVGGFRVVADQTARFAIPQAKQATGMWVMQRDTKDIYQFITAPAAAPTNASNWQRVFRQGGANEEEGVLGHLVKLEGDTSNNQWSAHINALGQAARHAGHIDDDPQLFKSNMANGMELLPTHASNKPQATLKTGSFLLPNGVSEHLYSDLTLDLGVSGSFVGGALPTYPDNVFLFLRRKAGLNSPVLMASLNPPQETGALSLSDTAEATYTRNDYGYVGMLRPIAASGAAYVDCWGSGIVAHIGDGVRVVMFDRILDVADAERTSTAATATLSNAALSTTVACGPTASPRTTFPTARKLVVVEGLGTGNLIISAGTVTFLVRATTPSSNLGDVRTSADNISRSVTQVVEMAALNSRPNVRLSLSLVGNPTNPRSIDVEYFLDYVGIVENVNAPIGDIQSSVGI